MNAQLGSDSRERCQGDVLSTGFDGLDVPHPNIERFRESILRRSPFGAYLGDPSTDIFQETLGR